MLKNYLETEFFLQPQCGQNIVVTVGVEMGDALSIQYFHEDFHSEIAGRKLGKVGSGFSDFVTVFAGLYKLVANQRGRFRPSSRKGSPACADSIGPVREFDPARVSARAVKY
jgi:hypothetical protein